VYNPASQPREASIVVGDGDTTRVDTEVTVPPRATVDLFERVLSQQTVGVAVTWNGTTTAYSWDVDDTLNIVLKKSIEISTLSENDTPRGLRKDGRVDVRLDGDDGQTGSVRVTHDDQIQFETEWTFSNSRRVTYHDRLDGTGERIVTAQRGATEASRRVSLSEVVQVVADIKRTVQIGVYDVDRGTDSKR
jgi:small nuclear ribonucleoprotein (snRNP)-like protein